MLDSMEAAASALLEKKAETMGKTSHGDAYRNIDTCIANIIHNSIGQYGGMVFSGQPISPSSNRTVGAPNWFSGCDVVAFST